MQLGPSTFVRWEKRLTSRTVNTLKNSGMLVGKFIVIVPPPPTSFSLLNLKQQPLYLGLITVATQNKDTRLRFVNRRLATSLLMFLLCLKKFLNFPSAILSNIIRTSAVLEQHFVFSMFFF